MPRRLIWILNHRTLMPDEVGLLRGLGWAVYTPRIVPKGGRSSVVEDRIDESLDMPADALDLLNSFPFYERQWSPSLSLVINRYFDVCVTAYYPSSYVSAVKRFRGMVVARCFGRERTANYHRYVSDWRVPGLEAAEAAMGDRLVFGPTEDGITEMEPPHVAARGFTLPLPNPGWVRRGAGTWTGQDAHLLFLCPCIATQPYYAAFHKTIKEQFGDLPHFIFGKQLAPVNDPCVLPTLTDDELIGRYGRCRAFLYLSPEARFLHYSPLEAMVVGAPVLYLKGSRLDREARAELPGACVDLAEMRTKARALLSGDEALSAAIRAAQPRILSRFSDDAARDAWKALLARAPGRTQRKCA
jgi:hypothetical protein